MLVVGELGFLLSGATCPPWEWGRDTQQTKQQLNFVFCAYETAGEGTGMGGVVLPHSSQVVLKQRTEKLLKFFGKLYMYT